ncbi:MAG: hypothetical protein K1X28_01270 [Parachlamydiales bacterium]|nr:hypothetical protein [Parachlamydiales bacterium]
MIAPIAQSQPSVQIEPSLLCGLYEIITRIFQMAVQWIFCGCCLKGRVQYIDPISNGLAQFDNPYVQGQVNGIYITTNETGLDETREFFQLHPPPPRPFIHIGCASWHNLDIIAERRSTYGLIIDFNPKNAEFIQKTAELIAHCDTREAFVNAMIQYLNSLQGSKRDLYFHWDQRGLPTERIERELIREGSWLQSNEKYQHLKSELVAKGRLAAITENIQNDEVFAEIRRFLDASGILVDTLYLSNICSFMQTEPEKAAYNRSVRALVNDNTIRISCPLQLRQVSLLGSE